MQLSGKILLIDDLLSDRDMEDRLLTKIGLEVDAAEDCAVGVNAYRSSKSNYDLVLLELDTQMRGYDAFRQIRAVDPDSLIIAMSRHSGQEYNIRELIDEGAFGFIPKPFSPRQLYQMVYPVFSMKSVDSLKLLLA